VYRYKLLVKSFFGIKSPLEKSILNKIDNLENTGMIDMMTHQFNRYKNITHFTMSKTIWQSWIRR
jgi:hypothetical protein